MTQSDFPISNEFEEGAVSPDRPSRCRVVAIGASAGGLEALESFFANVPPDCGASFVVVRHLSPNFDSHLSELLQRTTQIPVEVVVDQVQIRSNRIYVMPPGVSMVIDGDRLQLTPRTTSKESLYPIDTFFKSLATVCGEDAMAIILSGTGRDGTEGARSIAQQGGVVLAQESSTCEFGSMPQSAIDAGIVQHSVAPETLADMASQFADGNLSVDELSRIATDNIGKSVRQRAFAILNRSFDVDFELYKTGTVDRRILRQVKLTQQESVDDYLNLIDSDENEAANLFHDLLVAVTCFFRDPQAYEVLRRKVIPKLLESNTGREIRIWVCGCCTGEEAYGVAMLMAEEIQSIGSEISFKIFATDVDRKSLQFAVSGLYPNAKLDGVPDELRAKYFQEEAGGYRVAESLKRHMIFAPQNILRDPAFTQIDLVCCRNMLIYVQAAAQRDVMAGFHSALEPGGYLFLGPSESIGYLDDEFVPVSKHWNIYRKKRGLRQNSVDRADRPLRSLGSSSGTKNEVKTRRDKSDSTVPVQFAGGATNPESLIPVYDALLSIVMPPSVVVNDQFELLHAFDGSQDFLRFPVGRPPSSLLQLVPISHRNPLAGALRRAQQSGTIVQVDGLPHPSDSQQTICLSVRRFEVADAQQSMFLVQFDASCEDRAGASEVERFSVDDHEFAASRIESLEQDLSNTQSNLSLSIQQLEASNHELQVNNGEMVTANEELQSTNEELHSVNEELYTVNAEHQKRVLELDEANTDMKNLLASTRAGVIFLDQDFFIRRFTPEMKRIMSLQESDIGQNVKQFLSRFGDDDFESKLSATLNQQVENRYEVRIDQNSYLVRMMPYWRRSEASGLVVSFVDVTPLKKAEVEVSKFKMMADVNTESQVLLNQDGLVQYANHSMAKSLQCKVEDLLDQSISQFDTEMDRQSFGQHFERAKRRKGFLHESIYVRRDGSSFPVEVAVTYIEIDESPYLFASVRNITSRRIAESNRLLLQKAVEAIDNGILITDATKEENPITFCNSGFFRMTGFTADEVLGRSCRLLQGPDTDPQVVEKIRQAIRQKAPHRSLLLNYKKDGTPFWNDLYLTPVRDDNNEVNHFVGVLNDVTERIRISDQARVNEQTVRSLLDSTAEGIFGLDADGVCSFCNPSAARLLGIDSVETLVGRSMHEIIQPVDQSGHRYDKSDSTLLASVRSGESRTSRNEVFIRSDGQPLSVQWWCHPIKTAGGPIGGVVTFVDDTERKQFEQDLRDARDASDEANQAKSRFLATMSHELRTPLAAILGFAEILQQEDIGEQHIEKLTAIRRNGDYLLRLLNDVLDLSRIEVGKFQASPVEVPLDNLINDVRDTMNMRTEEYQTTLEFRLCSNLPAMITIDPNRVRQVLINLIANALKFASGGHVEVLVTFLPGDPSRLEFQVKDNGIGISPAQMTGLFKPFVQADHSIAQRFGGTGLGLSISRRLLDAMNGSVSVESEVGLGSTFTVRLPVSPCTQPIDLKLGNVSKKNVEGVLEKRKTAPIDVVLAARVLIADDMPDVRFIAEHFLVKYGCTVAVVENGRLAVDAIKASIGTDQKFDLVLMDMQMPVLDGIGAVKELRQAGITIPIVALTADAMKGTRSRLLAAGFDEYLSKPLDVQRLVRVVESLLD